METRWTTKLPAFGSQGVLRIGDKVPQQLQAAEELQPSPRSRKALLLYEGEHSLGACKWGLRLVTTTLGLSGPERPPMWKLRIPGELWRILECLKGGKEKERGCLARTQTRQAAILGGSMEMLKGCPRGVVLYTMHVKPGPISQELEKLEVEQVLKITFTF